jgi:hypothetical protein
MERPFVVFIPTHALTTLNSTNLTERSITGQLVCPYCSGGLHKGASCMHELLTAASMHVARQLISYPELVEGYRVSDRPIHGPSRVLKSYT